METKNRNCLRCNTEMTEVWLNKSIIIEEKAKGISKIFKAKTSFVNPFVCPKCGYLELVAENPAIFKE